MRFLLGIDGGGTKTDIALKDFHDRMYLTQTSGSNHETVGFERVRALLQEGIEKLLKKMDGNWLNIQAAVMGMAGIDLEIDKRNFTEKVVNKLPLKCNFLITNDAFIALKTATRAEKAILLNAGTGIKVFGTHNGKELYSDAAGIDTFQNRILSAMGRELELDEKNKEFAYGLARVMGVKDPYNYLQWIYLYNETRKDSCPFSKEQIRNFPIGFFELLKDGDKKARQIFELLIVDYVKLAAAMASKLGLMSNDFELVLSGSMFSKNTDLNFEELFLSEFIKSNQRAAPKKIIVLKQPHYKGALFEAEKIGRR